MQHFFQQTANARRQIYVGDKSSYHSIGSFNCLVQNPTTVDKEMLPINIIQAGRGFVIFCPLLSNVQTTDILTIEGIDYEVKDILDYNFTAIRYKKIFAIRGIRN